MRAPVVDKEVLMQGSLAVSFLYDTLAGFRARTVMMPLNDSKATVDERLKTLLMDEFAKAKTAGWTLSSHAVTLLPKLAGDDAKRVPFLMMGLVAMKGTQRTCETRTFPALTSGTSVEDVITQNVILMAQLAKKQGFRPTGHNVTFTFV